MTPAVPPSPAVSVVLPTHNERENLRDLLPQLHELLAGETYEIIVVDDASTDGSPDWLREEARRDPRLRPVFGDALCGIGNALQRGYEASCGEVIVSVDADLSFDTAVVRRLLERVRQGADLVIASRFAPGGLYEAPRFAVWRKRLVSGTANRLMRLLVPVGVSDFSINCRAIRRSMWERLVLRERTNLWLTEMIVEAGAAGGRVTEIPVVFRDRRFGTSKLRLGREMGKAARRAFGLVIRYWRARRAGGSGVAPS